ncbi:expressed hypothetical protein [Trichoplax adhaerens]|uniref:Uncharacterized protein n=1 Tax=Trichoplax adhaerens TaxID=10228 RepID=B3RY15_TRIAD|nr:expressed hypothetical protein [Trichoplax adhaerens]EDV24524.1 expressed hypothetical protein [Trichoplax adhaerens]|eukprot:XP_002112414.1 expressed hypothetical protein [Trichoplax adhaerens]
MVRYRSDDSDGDSAILLTPNRSRQGHQNKKKCYCAILSCVGTLIILVAIATIVLIAFHASCKITWQFNEDCDTIRNAIVNQIHNWTSDTNCQYGGEKCLYHLISETPKMVVAYHVTPKAHYRDNLKFLFIKDPGDGVQCEVQGFSASEIFYAILDFGTNYCNLHNLIVGSGIDRVPGYKEETSDSICTQYSIANCTHF